MSDLNVTVTPVQSLEISKDGVASSAKDQGQTQGMERRPAPVKSAQEKKTNDWKPTDLNYSISQEDKALHLKVKSADGDLLREVVFERIDPGLLDTKKLKGIFVDDNF
jgi:hypothetical protein